MNYALDALWWRLQTPQVRDLATLLTAPAPWHTSCELPVTQLLGNEGFRFLLNLDTHPQNLLSFLNKQPPHHNRLGIYAEQLLCFWFQYAPHCQLIGSNLLIVQNKQSLGAADFIVKIDQKHFHLELTCKYYGAAQLEMTAFAGLNHTDRLVNKVNKLEKQLNLLRQLPLFVMPEVNINIANLPSASIVRGMLFTPQAKMYHHSVINRFCWQGYWINKWTDWPVNLHKDTRFWTHKRLSLLAPARISSEETMTFEQIKHVEHGILAILQQRADGYWHEVDRIMKINNDEN